MLEDAGGRDRDVLGRVLSSDLLEVVAPGVVVADAALIPDRVGMAHAEGRPAARVLESP